MAAFDPAELKRIGARARDLLLRPKATWAVIAEEPTTTRRLFTGYVAYLAAIGPVASLIGALVFGWMGVGRDLHPTLAGAVVVQALSYVLDLAAVYLIGRFIAATAGAFGGAADEVSAMKVAAYFPTAAWLASGFAIHPLLAPFLVLGLYSLFLIWRGLPLITRVPASRAALYTLVVVVAAIVVEILVASIVGAITVAMLPAAPPLTV